MQIRKFEAEDMSEALAAVKEAMGLEAVIIATRTIPKTGLFGRPKVEVTAAEETSPTPQDHNLNVHVDDTVLEAKLAPLRRELAGISNALRTQGRSHELSALRTQLTDVRRLLGSIGTRVSPRAESLIDALVRADVDKRVAESIVECACNRGYDPEAGIPLSEDLLTAVITERLGGPLLSVAGGRQIVALVGPTGVGKTTTLAKLAARAALIDGKRVGLITVDTYRVGGVDQLRLYAELIQIGMHVAVDRASFHQAIERFADCDIIFVDTAGRGPNDDRQLRSLMTIFDADPVEIHLTLAASTAARDLRRIIERYRELRPKAVLFTKVDEASSLVALVNASGMLCRPLSYVAFGQRVPEDLARADTRALAQRIAETVLRKDTPESLDLRDEAPSAGDAALEVGL